ncbi:MAG TPA: hypothetical protein VHC49_14775 [Mycobacteriales bacterium]|nr:hypothetical protein [Mycobacteriales bacterium]
MFVQRRGIVLLAMAAVLTGCGHGGLPGDVYKLDKACSGTTYGDAAPYSGKAPHPVAVFMPSEVGQLLPETPTLSDQSAAIDGYTGKPAAVQLVACGTLKGAQRSGSCGGYLGLDRSIPMTRATYRIRVYELRTHRQVRSVVVQGADTTCPSSISANYTPKKMLSALTDEQWRTVLDGPVERPPK